MDAVKAILSTLSFKVLLWEVVGEAQVYFRHEFGLISPEAVPWYPIQWLCLGNETTFSIQMNRKIHENRRYSFVDPWAADWTWWQKMWVWVNHKAHTHNISSGKGGNKGIQCANYCWNYSLFQPYVSNHSQSIKRMLWMQSDSPLCVAHSCGGWLSSACLCLAHLLTTHNACWLTLFIIHFFCSVYFNHVFSFKFSEILPTYLHIQLHDLSLSLWKRRK